jgi:hypothetical protein
VLRKSVCRYASQPPPPGDPPLKTTTLTEFRNPVSVAVCVFVVNCHPAKSVLPPAMFSFSSFHWLLLILSAVVFFVISVWMSGFAEPFYLSLGVKFLLSFLFGLMIVVVWEKMGKDIFKQNQDF